MTPKHQDQIIALCLIASLTVLVITLGGFFGWKLYDWMH